MSQIRQVTTVRGNTYRVDPRWGVLVKLHHTGKYWQTVQGVPVDELDAIRELWADEVKP